MSHEGQGASSSVPVASFPPLSVAVETIGVMTIAMIGSSVSSQLVDLDIGDIALMIVGLQRHIWATATGKS